MDSKGNNKTTIYQSLNNTLNLDGYGFIEKDQEQQQPKIIIKGSNPSDVQRKNLELQQKDQLQDKFFKTTDHGFQKAMQFEAARLPAYLDYEGMEYYPIIASALDLFMEEATTIGENGKMLNIHSNKDRIKKHLEELFYDIINVNVNLPFWTRNLAKYGDNFVYLLGEKNKGITYVKQMVNYEMERIEKVQKGKPKLVFKQREISQEFNAFEIAHFRLLGDDKYLPYGSSILNKIRRVFRQLIMAEDAMLTYRIIRAGEKRVIKIDVGNIDDEDIEDYLYKAAARFKKQQHVNASDGSIDYRFNIQGNDEDFIIPVRNGNNNTGIETLAGASNLDQIADIQYLRDNLFTGIGVPKPFLGFQDAAGDGKNMAQLDVRFAKKVTRIQQAIIQELNKIAIIHLHYLGFTSEDLNDFTLSLTNPSTQQDLLQTELLTAKSSLYNDLTHNEGGIAAMSHTEAKKLIFHMSDKEIIDDFKKQRMERAIAQELQDTPLVIKNTGVFQDVDDKYSQNEPAVPLGMGGPEGEGEMGASGGDELPGGGDFQTPADLPPVENVQGRSIMGMTDENFTRYLESFVIEKKKIDPSNEMKRTILKENNNLNLKTKEMVKEINTLIGDKETLNTEIDFSGINIDEIDTKKS